MTSNFTRVLPIFAAAFALMYLIAEQWNLALFTYHARHGEFDWLVKASRNPANPASAPAMYWYGWIATSFLGAGALSIAALPFTRDRELPGWIGWAVPLAVMVVFVYLFRGFFIPR